MDSSFFFSRHLAINVNSPGRNVSHSCFVPAIAKFFFYVSEQGKNLLVLWYDFFFICLFGWFWLGRWEICCDATSQGNEKGKAEGISFSEITGGNFYLVQWYQRQLQPKIFFLLSRAPIVL